MVVLIHQGAQLPASAQSVFTTVHDNQTEVPLSPSLRASICAQPR